MLKIMHLKTTEGGDLSLKRLVADVTKTLSRKGEKVVLQTEIEIFINNLFLSTYRN